jgi:excisionase family DNA binding protein
VPAPSPIETSVITTEPWSAVEDVAKHLGVAKDSVYRWIESHRLPAHRVGRLWKFKLSEIDQWVRAGGAHRNIKQAPGGTE